MPFSPASASRLGKLAPLIALVISALGLFAPAAHAQGSQPPGGYTPAPGQGWVLYKYTQSASNIGGQLLPVPVPSVVMANANPDGVIGAGCQGGTGLTDTITPYFYWSGPGLAPQISEKLRGTATAQAFADMSLPPSLAHSRTASDGLGDAQVPQSQQIGVSSAGLHLLPVPNSQGAAYGTVVAGPAVTLNAGTPSAGTLAVNLSAAPDTRGVTLSRDGAHNETVDSDGTVHGDTIYSYQDTEPETIDSPFPVVQDITSPVDNWQTFHPNFQGNWSTKIYPMGNGTFTDYDVTWFWSPNESQDDKHDGLWKMPYGSMNVEIGNWVGTPTGASPDSPMTYTVTDNQNPATATAKYILTVHDINERQPDVVNIAHYLYSEVKGSNSTNNTSVDATFTFHVDTATATTQTFTYTGTVGVDWLSAWGINVGGSAAYGIQTQDTVTTGESQAYVLPPHTYFYPITEVFSQHEEFWVKSYDAGGFIGQAYQKTNSFNGPQSIVYTTSAIMPEPGWMPPPP